MAALRTTILLLIALLSADAVLAQCPLSLPAKVRQDKLYAFVAGFWTDKPDTLVGKDFYIEKPSYQLRIRAKTLSASSFEIRIFDTIETQINQIIFCDSKPAQVYFQKHRSPLHHKVLKDLLKETSSAEPVDSLYYLYDINTWEDFGSQFVIMGLGKKAKPELDTVALEEVYRFRKDWFIKYGPEFLEKSTIPEKEKEAVAEYLCKMNLCEYLEKLEDTTAPQFR